MAKRVSPTAIGAFVAGSFALLVAAIVVVGSGSLFRKPIQFICMFKGDLNGLKVGSAVKLRGVQIGSVSAIRLRLSPEEGRVRQDFNGTDLPVIVDIDRSQILAQGGTGAALGKTGFEGMIARGLRAQLKTESLLTGLLYIDLNLHPGAPLNLEIEPGTGPYREIPTIQTNLEEVQEQATEALAKLGKIDLQGLVTSITSAANSINALTSSPSLKTTLDSLKDTTRNLSSTLVSIRAAVDNANTKIDPLVASLRKSSDEANATMKETRAAVVALQSTLDSDSPLSVHLNDALDQLAETTRSVGALTDYLERNPSSLIRGKYVPDEGQ
ncbi:MAG TPA: MlaD family protein [Blastocatellia bacterium]|nr:MlaD family protein [Blastocatellia bacterium]